MKSFRRTGSEQADRADRRSSALPPKNSLVGEHGQAGGTAGFVLGGHGGGVETGIEITLGRRPPFDLGDHRHPVAGRHRPDGSVERADRPGDFGRRSIAASRSRWSLAASARWAARMESRYAGMASAAYRRARGAPVTRLGPACTRPLHTSLMVTDGPAAAVAGWSDGLRRRHPGGDRGRSPHLRPGGHVPSARRLPGPAGGGRRDRARDGGPRAPEAGHRGHRPPRPPRRLRRLPPARHRRAPGRRVGNRGGGHADRCDGDGDGTAPGRRRRGARSTGAGTEGSADRSGEETPTAPSRCSS